MIFKRGFSLARPTELLAAAWSKEWVQMLTVFGFIAWNILGIVVSCVNLSGPAKDFTPNYQSPLMHLLYLTPGYWIPPGLVILWNHSIGPFFTWLLGG